MTERSNSATDKPRKRTSGGAATTRERVARYRQSGRLIQVRLIDPAAIAALDAGLAAGASITEVVESALIAAALGGAG